MLRDRIVSLLLACISMLGCRFALYTPPEDAQIRLPDYGVVEPDAGKYRGIRSAVRVWNGVPTLFINDEPYPSAAYMTYLEPYNRYAQFADAGYSFFSMPVLFAGRWISTTAGLTPFGKGIFDDKDEPDFSVFDNSVQKILDACPDAVIIPRVNLSMPLWWIAEHPDCLDGTGNRESLYSDVWREEAARMLRIFIRHVLESDFAPHIAGYHLAGGNTEEWFHFDMNAGISPAAEKGYNDFLDRYYSGVPYTGLPDLSLLNGKGTYHKNENLARFLEYASVRIAESVAYLAHVAKVESGGNVVVGAFYGYLLEVPSPLHGTHALQLLLESKDVDFISSPNSYLGVRAADADWTEMYAADSVRLHGKLCMQECDIRTYRTRLLGECAPEYDPQNVMTAPIWHGLADRAASIAQLRKSFCRQLVKGNAFWWFDMWGGWYDDEAIMTEMRQYRAIYAQSLSSASRASVAEVAVFVDESANKWMTDCTLRNAICGLRGSLGCMGAPYDLYDIRDFETVYARYKCVLFVSGVKTTAVQNAVQICKREKIPFLITTKLKPSFKTAQLRAFCRSSGVHLYWETDDIVYVNDRYIAIHANEAGEKTIRLPQAETLTALLGEPQIRSHGTDVTITLAQDETVLLERAPV